MRRQFRLADRDAEGARDTPGAGHELVQLDVAVAAADAARGLSGIASRIDAYDAPWLRDRADAAAYVSPLDLNDLLMRCIEVEEGPYAGVAGISNNACKCFTIEHTRALLGDDPRDDGVDLLGLAPSG